MPTYLEHSDGLNLRKEQLDVAKGKLYFLSSRLERHKIGVGIELANRTMIPAINQVLRSEREFNKRSGSRFCVERLFGADN